MLKASLDDEVFYDGKPCYYGGKSSFQGYLLIYFKYLTHNEYEEIKEKEESVNGYRQKCYFRIKEEKVTRVMNNRSLKGLLDKEW